MATLEMPTIFNTCIFKVFHKHSQLNLQFIYKMNKHYLHFTFWGNWGGGDLLLLLGWVDICVAWIHWIDLILYLKNVTLGELGLGALFWPKSGYC